MCLRTPFGLAWEYIGQCVKIHPFWDSQICGNKGTSRALPSQVGICLGKSKLRFHDVLISTLRFLPASTRRAYITATLQILAAASNAPCVIPGYPERITEEFFVSEPAALSVDIFSRLVELKGDAKAARIQVGCLPSPMGGIPNCPAERNSQGCGQANSQRINPERPFKEGKVTPESACRSRPNMAIRSFSCDIGLRQTIGQIRFRTSFVDIPIYDTLGEYDTQSPNGDMGFERKLLDPSDNQFVTTKGDIKWFCC